MSEICVPARIFRLCDNRNSDIMIGMEIMSKQIEQQNQNNILECIEQAGKNGVPLVVLDVPLLFECGMDVLCDETWVVALSPERQLQRLMDRDGLSEQEALQRIASQMPLEEKMQRATVVIDNNRSEDKLKSELTALYHITLRRAERENS